MKTDKKETMEEDKDYKTMYLYKAAELENYRKRMADESTNRVIRTEDRFITNLLPIIDDLEKMVEHEDSEGGRLVLRKVHTLLTGYGVERMDILLGQTFDPDYHEAIQAEAGATRITAVLREGYVRGPRIIRPAGVAVRP